MGRKFWIALAAVLSGLGAHGVFARPHTPGMVQLKVSVFNDAAVAQPVLQAAETRAEAVLAEAGISLTWLDCGAPGHWHTELACQDLAFPTHLSVRLVAGKKAVSPETFGQSFLNERGEGNYASVYVERLSSSKALDLVNEGDLLGYVMVHELGHLLLGKDSHSTDGLMRAKWEVAELREAAKGKLLFTRNETELMRVRYCSAVARAAAAPTKQAASGK
jgi:hypothetical protein